MKKIFSFLFLSLSISLPAMSQESLDIGSKAPNLKEWGLTYSKTQPTVVAFWATWCQPCKESIPILNAIYNSQQAKVQGVALENEYQPEVFETLRNFLASKINIKPDFPNLIDHYVNGALNDFLKSAGNFTIPTVIVVSKDGRIAYVGPADDASFSYKLQQIQEGTWDYAKAQKAYAENRRQRRLDVEARKLSLDLRMDSTSLTPEGAYEKLLAALAQNPRLFPYQDDRLIKLSITLNKPETAADYVLKALTYILDRPVSLESMLHQIDAAARTHAELNAAQVRTAELLFLATQGESKPALRVLQSAGLEQACDGDRCLPLPKKTGQCLDLFIQ